MYIEKEPIRGYNPYLEIDVNNGQGSMMDIGLLIMEDGDIFKFHEEDKELAWIIFSGKATLHYAGGDVDIDRQTLLTTLLGVCICQPVTVVN